MAEQNGSGPTNAKVNDLQAMTEDGSESYLTTNQGIRIEDDHNSLKAGERGPTLLEDFILREKITHFDHERIPERVVHARGSAAHGVFQVYEPLTELTKARLFQDPNVQTPVFVRFSTVAGSRGSADTARDVRGFAVKFYTEDGVWDLVGNNIPVFFIQDGIKFPDLVHSFKPEPHHEIPQASTAHDTFWDFISLMPESMHMIMWIMSDRAIPRSFRMMEGFGVHTFRLVNEQGVSRFVKFHWKPLLGVHSLVWDEAQKLAGKDPDFHRRDLWEAIARGDYPEWELGVQIVEEADEGAFDFDLLDSTKIIPEELVPVQRVGRLTLNRNPDNFFAETEQVAFHPGHVVPGIDFSDDPLLAGRLFSYLDTQLTRLGGPNFAEIPINRPLAPVHNNQRDGFMRQTINRGRANYEPNSLGGGCPMHAGEDLRGYVTRPQRVEGRKVRERAESFRDNFSQATLFWQSMSEIEQRHIVEALQFELGKVEHKEIRQRMVALLANVDSDLASRVAKGIGVSDVSADLGHLSLSDAPTPNERRGAAAPGRSEALSMESAANKETGTAKGRKVAVLVADGVDGAGLATVRAALEAAGALPEIVAKFGGAVTTSAGEALPVDKTFLTTGSVDYDAVLVPGGAASVATLVEQGPPRVFVTEAFKHGKAIAALAEGVELLHACDLPGVTLSSDGVSGEQGVVSAGPGAPADALGQRLIAAIAAHRHWDRAHPDLVPA